MVTGKKSILEATAALIPKKPKSSKPPKETLEALFTKFKIIDYEFKEYSGFSLDPPHIDIKWATMDGDNSGDSLDNLTTDQSEFYGFTEIIYNPQSLQNDNPNKSGFTFNLPNTDGKDPNKKSDYNIITVWYINNDHNIEVINNLMTNIYPSTKLLKILINLNNANIHKPE